MLHGGPNTQLRMTARHLPECGIEAGLFDPWRYGIEQDYDLFHLFAANIGTVHLARELHARNLTLVVSPIMFSRHSAQFIRRGLGATRLLQKGGPGIWSDYSIMADICSWATAVLPNTKAEADLVTHGLGCDPSRITVVPNGVEERFAHATPDLFRKTYGMDQFILHVGHVGYERKNVLNLVKVLGGIDHPSVIIGRSLRTPYAEACLAEAAKHKQILVIDGIDHETDLLASAYAASRVFVLPSQFETPGIAALEAGLAGAEVVITSEGGTREYFGSFAEYVDPRSNDSIREGILTALGKPSTRALRDHILAEFTWQQVARKTADVYRHVVGQ